MKVASAEVQTATMMLVFAASQTSRSPRMVSYHFRVNDPSGIVGNRSQLNEKMTLVMIGENTNTNTNPR